MAALTTTIQLAGSSQTMNNGERIRSALESIPRGQFLLTAAQGARSNAVLVDFVGQCANDPPMLAVATAKGQVLTPVIRDSRTFAVSLVTDATWPLARRFVRSNVENEDPFIGLPVVYTPRGIPILARTEVWFECELVRHLDIDADCELYVGTVAAVHQEDGADSGVNEITTKRRPLNGRSRSSRHDKRATVASMAALLPERS